MRIDMQITRLNFTNGSATMTFDYPDCEDRVSSIIISSTVSNPGQGFFGGKL